MFDRQHLLQNEFFPSELPPCFSTVDLAVQAASVMQALDKANPRYSIPLVYSGYKSESSRRKFAVPNPYHYCQAVDCIVKDQSDIKAILEGSTYSLTAPIDRAPKANQPYAKRSSSIADTKREIEKLYQNNRYEIRLDINSFFDNVYTHSIPWAIHGIAQAKKKRNDMTLLGNRLDKLMRALNYEQTNGILVGNAVSRIISEIILCTVDKQIREKFPNISCCRFVDDYYIYTQNSIQIQEIISFIRARLSQYELNFNENKIQINESPFLYGKPWVEQIKQYIHLRPDIFLSKLIMEYNINKDIAVIKYGLKVISQCRYTATNWPAMQSRLLNLWVRFPSLSDRILPILWQNKALLKILPLKNAIYSVIDESLLLNREQELIWAVWFVKVFKIQISQPYIVKILSSTTDLAIIIMLDVVYSSGLEKKQKIQQKFQEIRGKLSAADEDEKGNHNTLMWTSHWLLAYEANRMKWLTLPNNPLEYANKNAFFEELLKMGVKFYDPTFTYAAPQKYTKNYEYATRTELYAALSKLKKAISGRLQKDTGEEKMTMTEEEYELYEEFIHTLEEEERIY